MLFKMHFSKIILTEFYMCTEIWYYFLADVFQSFLHASQLQIVQSTKDSEALKTSQHLFEKGLYSIFSSNFLQSTEAMES